MELEEIFYQKQQRLNHFCSPNQNIKNSKWEISMEKQYLGVTDKDDNYTPTFGSWAKL